MLGHIFGYHNWGEGCHWHPVGMPLTSPFPHSPESSPNVCNVMVERVRSKEMFPKHTCLPIHLLFKCFCDLGIKREGSQHPGQPWGNGRELPSFPTTQRCRGGVTA